jgi:phosphoserine aminotransferase
MTRIHNFSAGPGVLPSEVLEQAQQDLLDFRGSGMGIAECSHRSALFDEVIVSARNRLRALLNLDDSQEVLFLQGGARTQFFMVPMNLLQGGCCAYLDTGQWSKHAIIEAERFGKVNIPFSSRDSAYDRVPDGHEWDDVPDELIYLHYTSNNTVAGTEYHYVPQVRSGLLVCDMSSNILSREIPGHEFDLIYAGSQKNMGPAGVTVVIIRRDLLEQCAPDLPLMLRYQTHVDKESLYNTPCTFGIYMIERVCHWIESMGGIEAVSNRNQVQASQIYDLIDGSEFWQGKVIPSSRSFMNITFTTGDEGMDEKFWKTAEAEGMSGLKGHRSMGGLRASIYNAQTQEAVDTLVHFMGEFEASFG